LLIEKNKSSRFQSFEKEKKNMYCDKGRQVDYGCHDIQLFDTVENDTQLNGSEKNDDKENDK